ncbi:anthranilate synthase component I [Kaistia dalseonensis]|uniref:Anthranilate synthase component 1 n=1 Tax=Kaistia dalseonensis TaxID=410840 RepID=A0ABU0H385_9HYPH|nr:anthranilate synthase component I [Kaistia dalseonensis]MCX5494180.1 anthranilate synthase component I [Kaistia dalseonensis]MDQ0436759.1 anthranilate synthase component 1 [Kaistia dalseonensis]
MLIEPSPETIARTYDDGRAQVVWTRMVADLETPVSAMLKLSAGRINSFLLESVEGGAVRGRYSMIGIEPDLLFRAFADRAEINRSPSTDRDRFEPIEGKSLDALRTLIAQSHIELPESLPPMSAGIFGYLGYDMVRQMEDLGPPNPAALDVPDAIMMRPTVMVVFDAIKDEITIVTPIRPEPGVTASQAHARAVERLTGVVDTLEGPLHRSADPTDVDLDVPVVSNTPHERYLEMVAKAKEYIAAGDIFQVVLSQRFEAPFTLPPFALYRALRRTNPSPFLYFLDFGDFAVAGSSPEILVRVRDGEVTIRPIAGTRRRGATPEQDKALAAELLADPKELAEHLMLLDLGRNDVGRVSEIGTVKVTDKFFLEYYSQVMHIVSNVIGRLSSEYDMLDALAAGFPAGTVSGAPKVRAMEIIDELEVEKRGIYAGCVGYFSADGAMDTCIVLRTSIVKDGKMYAQAGAGVVADSVPESEHQECIAKARALFRAAEEAVKFASQAGRGQ